jgi:hypothetical protein
MTYEEIDKDESLYIDFIDERVIKFTESLKRFCLKESEIGALEALDDVECIGVVITAFILETFQLLILKGYEEEDCKMIMKKMVDCIQPVEDD